MKLDIHIGHTKTGTSQFQNLMTISQDELAKQGILYPKSGVKFNAHHGLVRLLVEQKVKTVTDPTVSFEEFVSEVKAANLPRVIISSEGFSNAQAAKAAFALLDKEFDVSVHLFLRPPISWLNSQLNQTYKSILYEDAYSGDGEAQYQLVESLINDDMQFQKLIQVWEAIVGVDRFNVHCLESGDDYLLKITDALNVTLDFERLRKVSTNPSLCGDSLNYLSWLSGRKAEMNHAEKVRFINILNEYSKKSGKKVNNFIPNSLTSLAQEQSQVTRDEISAKYFNHRDILSERKLVSAPFDFDNYDSESVLKVNAFVLSKLDRHVQFLKKQPNRTIKNLRQKFSRIARSVLGAKHR